MSPIVSGGGASGNTTSQVVASGKLLPVAFPSAATVDSTTYSDPFGGASKITVLVYSTDEVFSSTAIQGDAFPRVCLLTDPTDGWYFGDGTFNPYTGGAYLACYILAGHGLQLSGTYGNIIVGADGPGVNRPAPGLKVYPRLAFANGGYLSFAPGVPAIGGEVGDLSFRTDGPPDLYRCTVAGAAGAATWTPELTPGSPLGIINSGSLPTLTITSGTGRQIITTRDTETVTPFTGDGTNNAATCAVALSPDNVTYSTLVTISIAAALNLTGVLTDNVNVRVPAGWYIKLTATHGTLGTTTYY